MGLSRLEITESQVNMASEYATTLASALEDSSSKSKSLLAKVESSSWSGDAQKSFVAYLNIVQQFHTDLYNASKKQVKALEAITKGIASYETNAEVTKVKNL